MAGKMSTSPRIDLTQTPALDWLPSLTEAAAAELQDILRNPMWEPVSLQQIAAICSPADELYYGGAAGGGKTDLLLGLALTQHRRSAIYRREAVQLKGIEDRMREIAGAAMHYNGQSRVARVNGRHVQLGAMKELNDWKKHQGVPRDFQGFDEAAHFIRSQVMTLRAWNRTTVPTQRCRRVLASNPPTDPEGYWIIEAFAPWIDEYYYNPAMPGELRWYAVFDGSEVEVPSGEPIDHKGRMVKPFSRTFIPAKVEDNPYLMETGYLDTLDALPEPLRSMMRDGSFTAGNEDDAWQVIPTAWVKAAQARWSPDHPDARLPMDAMGVDVARGGRDETIISRRHGRWFAPLAAAPGIATPDGPSAAALVVAHRRDAAPVHVDIIGVGGSVFDHLVSNGIQTVPINGAGESQHTDRSGQLRFANKRAELTWKMREALDPNTGDGLALPPDRALLADLCASRWKLTARGIAIESKEDIIKRIGRSPDRGDAVCYARVETLKDGMLPGGQRVLNDYSLLG